MASSSFHIVVLDGYTLAGAELNWHGLERFGTYSCYDRTLPDQVIERSREADAILVNKVCIDAKTISELPRLKYIGVTATGVNIVDVSAAKSRDITVTNVPGYATASVAQTVFAHLLNLAQRVEHHAHAVRDGRWTSSPDFCFWETPQIEISGLTMGIVGFGAIGNEVARIANSFGMHILATNRSPKEHPGYVSMVDIDTLFRQSDVVTLHCPLTSETREIVNQTRLSTMKPSAFIINTGRGQLIDERALADALSSGQIAGAGLDVLSHEPPPADHVLLTAPNCFITPHYGWATRSARTRLMATVIENLSAFIEGRPRNVV